MAFCGFSHDEESIAQILEFIAISCVIAFNTLPLKDATQDAHFLVI